MRQLIEEFVYTEAGYKPCLITPKWQAALLNYADSQAYTAMDKLEKHVNTDEVFVLLEGTATLIAAELDGDKIIKLNTKLLEQGVIYNIPAGVWHNIAMKPDARLLILEDANTHLNDVIYQSVGRVEV